MRVFGLAIPHGISSVRAVELSKRARQRLQWMKWYEDHGRNARLVCRHFAISPATFYLWKHRFEASGPAGLKDGSQRPKNVRTPTWTKQFENAVRELRLLTGWGKDKLAVLLREQGWPCSTSMVGRILGTSK